MSDPNKDFHDRLEYAFYEDRPDARPPYVAAIALGVFLIVVTASFAVNIYQLLTWAIR